MQDTSHKAGDYSRPNLNWQCGQEDCCQLGPTVNGKCSKSQDPCVPQRTVKAKKRIAAILLVSVLVSVMSLFLTAEALLNNVSPGPISPSHTEVASCQNCHSGASNDLTQWFKTAATRIIGVSDSGQHDDQQCLDCHALGENAFFSHSTSSENFTKHNDNEESLVKQSSSNLKLSLASSIRNFQVKDSEEITCSTCHQEHKGDSDPRANFNSNKCGTCHEVQFDNVELGHPEYSNYPYTQPTHINYDHSNHKGKYFYDDNYIDRAPQECQDCHFTDQTGEWMMVKSFEEVCSSCHIDDVLGMERESSKGIAVFTIPELDIKTLNDAGFNTGEWPSTANGELTPFMRALLTTSFKKSSLLQSKNLSLADLSNANQDQLETAALLVWEIKSLFYELLRGGTAAFDHRLSSALGQTMDQSTMNRLIAALPKDTLLKNQEEWFPSLMEELSDFRSGKIRFKQNVNEPEASELTLETTGELNNENAAGLSEIIDELKILTEESQAPKKKAKKRNRDNMADEEWAVSGGWYREGSSIRYRPTGHADLFFKTWLDLSAAQFGALDDSLFKALSTDESVGNCTQCHTVESNLADESSESHEAAKKAGKAKYKMNWLSFRPGDVLVDFNRFSHVTHLNKDCLDCHVLHDVPGVDRRHPTVGVAVSGFEYMQSNTCTQCHQEDRAPDNCLTCHNYHPEPHLNIVDSMPDILRPNK